MQQFERDFSDFRKTLSLDEGIKNKIQDIVRKAKSLRLVGYIMKTSVPDLISKETTETREP